MSGDSLASPPPKSRRGLIVGCATVALVGVAACAGGIYWAYGLAQDIEDTVQAQATALGRGNDAEVCRHNSARYLQATPCEAYVAWLRANAPFFAGSDVAMQGISRGSSQALELTVQATSAGSSGRLTFSLVRDGSQWRVDGVRPPH